MGSPQDRPSHGYAPVGSGTPGPDAGIAIAAAALSLMIGLVCAYGCLSGAVFAFTQESQYVSSDLITDLVRLAAVAVLWLLGAALLFLRTTVGRVLVIVMSVVGLIYAVAMIIHTRAVITPMWVPAPLAALILAAAKPTGRWIAAKPSRHRHHNHTNWPH